MVSSTLHTPGPTDEEIAAEGADAVNETVEEKTEQAVENQRKSEACESS